MRNLTRFIPGEDIHAVTQWDFGDVDADLLKLAELDRARQSEADSARDETMRGKSHSEGFAEGFAQGQAMAVLQGEQQLLAYIDDQGRELAAQFAKLLESTQAQLAESQQVMARGVLELACEVARQVLRHELSVNPNVVLPVVREALTMLADDSKSAVVRLNPLDLDVLQETLQSEFAGLSLTLMPDSSIAPGGCRISSAGAVVDGDLHLRWRRAIAKLGLELDWDD
ncbi:MAG: flagellar assembly protein FliH [Burkholderiaceae bacterium]